jgi:hypothetical protein
MKLEDMFTTLGDPTFKVYNIEDEKNQKIKGFLKKDFK